MHATVVAIGGRGVMIRGPSGSGKSDLALRLIDRGAVLVGDDYCEFVEGLAKPAPTIAGRIEVRGLGILDMPHIASAPVALVVDLETPPDRFPDAPAQTGPGTVPVIRLSPFEASAPIKVELALTRLGLPLEPPSQ